jgi:hypothetical protein
VRNLCCAFLTLFAGLFLVQCASAQDKTEEKISRRWELDFQWETPRSFTYQDPAGHSEVYWYMIYKLTNNTDKPRPELESLREVLKEKRPELADASVPVEAPQPVEIPVTLDIFIEAQTGRQLQFPTPHMEPGVCVQAGQFPVIEDEIIAKVEKLLGYAPTFRKEIIAQLKGANTYLNIREMNWVRTGKEDWEKETKTSSVITKVEKGTDKLDVSREDVSHEVMKRRVIKPGETVTGLAIFPMLNPRMNMFTVYVSGLKHVVKHKTARPAVRVGGENPDPQPSLDYEYENQVLKIHFSAPGDEFYRHTEIPEYVKKEWGTYNLGPFDNKYSIKKLVDLLENEDVALRQSAITALVAMTGDQYRYQPSELDKSSPSLADNRSKAAEAFAQLAYQYDPMKSPAENKEAISAWREWWFVNCDKIQYDSVLRRFVVK